MSELKLLEEHLSRKAAMWGERTKPSHNYMTQTLAAVERQKLFTSTLREHRVIRTIEPCLCDIVLLRIVPANLIERYAELVSDTVQMHFFPRPRLRKLQCGLEYSLLKAVRLVDHRDPMPRNTIIS